MNRLLLAVLLVLSTAVQAQWGDDDDAPIPYDDGPEVNDAAPKRGSRPRDRVREEDEDEEAAEETLAHLDDPNIGVGGDLIAGVVLLDSSKGALVEPRFLFGVRFTWEFGRLIPDEYLREMFFADVSWQYTAYSAGTAQVHTDTSYNYFTAAPAFALPLGKSFMSAYAQLGVGFSYVSASQYVGVDRIDVGGTKFLLQYGLGLRGRPAVVADGSVRIAFRVEVTRFLRGYMSDTFIGVGAGAVF